jgi:hypothetical protein
MSSTRMTMTLGREAAAWLTAACAKGKVKRDRRLMRAAAGAEGMAILAYRTRPEKVKTQRLLDGRMLAVRNATGFRGDSSD